MKNNRITHILLLLVIFLFAKNAKSYIIEQGKNYEIEDWDNENSIGNLKKEVNCSIPDWKKNNCQNCLDIDKNCLWCLSSKTCQKYDGFFQNCNYEDSRVYHCDLPYTAVIIFFIGLAVIVFFVCIVVFCCVCSKMDKCAKWNRNRIYIKETLKAKIQKDSLSKEQEQRKMARQARMDELRVKYGIKLSSPSFTRMNSFRSKKDQSNI
uniref:PSI domain-containing protein n=1 Tax=Strongyloides venezuelensis TaxID=75913 RepID=A0A0K0F4W8_STRVS